MGEIDGGLLSGGYCPGGNCPGDIVLDPINGDKADSKILHLCLG